MLPTLRPASSIAVLACSWVKFLTSGTWAFADPDEMVSATDVPSSTRTPCCGSWVITVPAGTVSLAFWVVVAVSPAVPRLLTAWAWVSPVTRGTATCFVPEPSRV